MDIARRKINSHPLKEDHMLTLGKLAIVGVTSFLIGLPIAVAQENIAPTASGGTDKPITIPANPKIKDLITEISKDKQPKSDVKANYIGSCGSSYVCYSGKTLNCRGSRPYESISYGECYCWSDSC
jgi:hypothetical protein